MPSWTNMVPKIYRDLSSLGSPCYPLSTKEVSFFVFELFQEHIQPVKTILASDDEYCFLLLLLQAIVIIMGIALINAKAKSVIVFAIILFSCGIERDSWLMTRLALSCNSQSYNDLQSALSSTPWYRPSRCVEAWKSSAKVWSVNQDYDRLHTQWNLLNLQIWLVWRDCLLHRARNW